MAGLKLTWEWDKKHPWEDIISWCEQSFGPDYPGVWMYTWGGNYKRHIYFYDQDRLNWFLLRWS